MEDYDRRLIGASELTEIIIKDLDTFNQKM